MLIINADDWGKNKLTTDRSLSCYKNGRITSASAMVFMADSERASELALENKLDTGLHLNFILKFDGNVKSSKLKSSHQLITSFLAKNKYCLLIYNPLLTRQFDYVYKAQYEEYVCLYNQKPTHIDGHKHMHLCTNMIVDSIIPHGYKIRRNFSFACGEKGFLNRFYRYIVDKWIIKKYFCTDYFFDFVPFYKERLQKIVNYAQSMSVELMVHPERAEEFNILMSNQFQEIIFKAKLINYSELKV